MHLLGGRCPSPQHGRCTSAVAQPTARWPHSSRLASLHTQPRPGPVLTHPRRRPQPAPPPPSHPHHRPQRRCPRRPLPPPLPLRAADAPSAAAGTHRPAIPPRTATRRPARRPSCAACRPSGPPPAVPRARRRPAPPGGARRRCRAARCPAAPSHPPERGCLRSAEQGRAEWEQGRGSRGHACVKVAGGAGARGGKGGGWRRRPPAVCLSCVSGCWGGRGQAPACQGAQLKGRRPRAAGRVRGGAEVGRVKMLGQARRRTCPQRIPVLCQDDLDLFVALAHYVAHRVLVPEWAQGWVWGMGGGRRSRGWLGGWVGGSPGPVGGHRHTRSPPLHQPPLTKPSTRCLSPPRPLPRPRPAPP